MTRRVPMSARVEAIVRRAGGTLREDAVVAQLAAAYGLWWARDAVGYALRDGRVVRRYADGFDALTVPDEEPRR